MSYADREIVVSGFTIAAAAIVIGCIVQFTRHGPLNHVLGYALVACGIVLLFVSYLARARRGNIALLRLLLIAIAGALLIGVLLKDAIENLF
jgi:ABC-type Fe3+-siderophore transport system permease subunit